MHLSFAAPYNGVLGHLHVCIRVYINHIARGWLEAGCTWLSFQWSHPSSHSWLVCTARLHVDWSRKDDQQVNPPPTERYVHTDNECSFKTHPINQSNNSASNNSRNFHDKNISLTVTNFCINLHAHNPVLLYTNTVTSKISWYTVWFTEKYMYIHGFKTAISEISTTYSNYSTSLTRLSRPMR